MCAARGGVELCILPYSSLSALHMYFTFNSHFTVFFVHLEQWLWKVSFLILPRTTSLTPPCATVSR
jgi:hypothetical protein